MRPSRLAAAAFLTFLMGALATGPAAWAQASPAPEKAPAEVGKSEGDSTDRDKLICKKDGVTGSRLRTTRICKTQAEWDDLNRAGRTSVDNMSRLLEKQIYPEPRGG